MSNQRAFFKVNYRMRISLRVSVLVVYLAHHTPARAYNTLDGAQLSSPVFSNYVPESAYLIEPLTVPRGKHKKTPRFRRFANHEVRAYHDKGKDTGEVVREVISKSRHATGTRLVDCRGDCLYSLPDMTIQQIKKEVAELSVEKQAELVAYLIRLRNQRDPSFKRRLSKRVGDTERDRWLTPDQFEKRLGKN